VGRWLQQYSALVMAAVYVYVAWDLGEPIWGLPPGLLTGGYQALHRLVAAGLLLITLRSAVFIKAAAA
jgi:hypothetical protein